MGGLATPVYISTLRYRDGCGLRSTARREGQPQQRALKILAIGRHMHPTLGTRAISTQDTTYPPNAYIKSDVAFGPCR
jgi:hypothetical protein